MGMYIQDDYWEAAQSLSAKQRAEFFDAIVMYHFAGEEPAATGAVAACFALCRDRIDKAKQMAENGRKGGKANAKQTGSKTEANAEQNRSNPIKEREREIEGEQEPSGSCESESPSGDSCRAGARRKPTAAEVKEIVAYLNAKTGKSFKADSKATVRQINARYAEGYTLSDFRRVIDSKVAEWAGVVTRDGRSMDDYLCPETLFSTKFERYLNSGKAAPKTDPRGASLSDEDRAFMERMGVL